MTPKGFCFLEIIKFRGQVASAKSILSIVALSAVMGSILEIEARGDDAQDALKAVETLFSRDATSDEAVAYNSP